MFEEVKFFKGDPILSMIPVYEKDPRSNKANLGIGIYYDDDGKLPLLDSIRQAEELLISQHIPKSYLPMEGLLELRKASQFLLFGEDNPLIKEGLIQTVQTVAGSGALRIAADFLREYFPQSQVHVSDPTWSNHISIFQAAGFVVKKYPYYDYHYGDLAFEPLIDYINKLKRHSIILMQPCCHNPTGVNLNHEQWDQLLSLLKEKQLILIFDSAYQGLGEGLAEDAYAIRRAAYMGLNFLLCNSYSKNMSLYGERVGVLSVVAENQEIASNVFSQFQLAVRRLYSSPPRHGGHLASIVLNTPQLSRQWVEEVDTMRARISNMRRSLQKRLSDNLPEQNFSYLTKQQGMFSFTGLTPEQVEFLRKECAVYLVANGRICISALNQYNIDYVAESFVKVLQK